MTFIQPDTAAARRELAHSFPPHSVEMFYRVLAVNFGMMKLVFLAIVVYEAWVIPRPPSSTWPRDRRRRAARASSRTCALLPEPAAGAAPPPQARGSAATSRPAAVGGGLLFVLGKAKFVGLLAGALKWKTLATMLLSIGAYALEWGWAFAAGSSC